MARTTSTALLALGCSALGLLVLEVVVRVADVAPRPLEPLHVPNYQISDNPVIGYEYRPGYGPTDEPFDSSHRGYSINSAGFRDHEYPLEKPPGVYRILVLGDSTTAGNGIANLDRTYTKVLEKILNEDGDRKFEVLNMGVGGYHTMQQVETLRVKGIAYDPDLVFLTFCLNDFSLHADGGVYRNLASKNASPRISSRWYASLLRASRLAFVVHHRLMLLTNSEDHWYAETVLHGKSPVEAGFALLSELQGQHGFSAMVLILPGFSSPFDEYAFTAIHRGVFLAAQDLPGITVLDLLEHFAEVDANADRFAFDGLHMNGFGHATMAEILAPIVREQTSSRRP